MERLDCIVFVSDSTPFRVRFARKCVSLRFRLACNVSDSARYVSDSSHEHLFFVSDSAPLRGNAFQIRLGLPGTIGLNDKNFGVLYD